MKHKVGDRVKVRSDLEAGERYGGLYFFNERMLPLKGKELVIKSIWQDNSGYTVNDNVYTWTDEMFEGLAREERKVIYASELMEALRKGPEKYEGKRYKVAEGYAVDVISGERVYSIDIAGGRFYSNNNGIAITASVVLEEIPPEPKPVSFIEAVEAYGKGETIRCKINHGGRTYEYDYIPQFTCDFGYKFVAKGSCEISSGEILRGKWFIVRKEC